MNDEEYEALKEKVLALCEKWRNRLNLQNWSIDYFWHRSGLPEELGEHPKGTSAVSECDWRYLYAQIHFNMVNLKGRDDDRLENTVVHEFMHCWIDELARPLNDAKVSGADDHVERVTTILSNIMQWNDESDPPDTKTEKPEVAELGS